MGGGLNVLVVERKQEPDGSLLLLPPWRVGRGANVTLGWARSAVFP
jgi:hypothetical protein